MIFREYMHIERYGNDKVQGIELGECYIFPKLDGTNGSVWLRTTEQDFPNHWCLEAGNRKRKLSLTQDNAGFLKFILESYHETISKLFLQNRYLRLYGEWLVPHSLRTYEDSAWNKFYVFDVWHDKEERYLSYPEYQPLLENYNIDYIPPISIIKNVTYDNLLKELENNTFLIKNGSGVGEGLVVKNYNFVNQWGRTIWAKIINNAFKITHTKKMGAVYKTTGILIEQNIVNEFITQHLVSKTYAKIVNDNKGWNSKYIPMLFGMVFYDLITEEIWNILKKFKNPTINFKTLNTCTILKIKELKPELF